MTVTRKRLAAVATAALVAYTAASGWLLWEAWAVPSARPAVVVWLVTAVVGVGAVLAHDKRRNK